MSANYNSFKGIENLFFLISILIISSCQTPNLEERVDEVVSRYNIRNGPGGVVGIIKGDQILYIKTFGYADVAFYKNY